jgi:hypothetical protein
MKIYSIFNEKIQLKKGPKNNTLRIFNIYLSFGTTSFKFLDFVRCSDLSRFIFELVDDLK